MTSLGGATVGAALAVDWTQTALVHTLGFGLLACLAATGVTFVYRGYSTRSIPTGGAVLVGVSAVALWLNAAIWLDVEVVVSETVGGGTPLANRASAAYLLGVFVASGVTAELGRRLGDHLGCEVFDITTLDARGEVATLVRSAGLVVEVELPETIEDINGYSPAGDGIKRDMAGRTMLVPRRLTIDELRDRLSARLRRDFDVDHVHLELAAGGAVDHLAIGVQPDGIGPSLPPETVAVAIRSDPSPAASTGDPVEVWTDGGESSRLVTTGTVRATLGDVTTVVVDAAHADAFATDETYRLVMQPATPDDGHELASVLRAAEETVTVVDVEPDGPLRGEFVGWLPGRVLVLERGDELLPFPGANRTLEAGDTVFVLGSPTQLRQLLAYDSEREDERSERRGPRSRDGGSSSGSDVETADADTESGFARGVLSKLTQ
ncbi:cation:proton antiporter regulatory subunit [Halomontanus rarus]|uniref:cation:proton antiporter regulatory subunit n=1 Tax=Halomontanus rarus TaxID=3034020 RepID=UPI0023E8D0D1|nr:TrkA C-terminal domain-containing protein [Halovivax sp. TS33]